MSTPDLRPTPLPARDGSRRGLIAAVGAGLGSAVAGFDLVTYGAATVISSTPLAFPGTGVGLGRTGLIAFAVGFLARPVGGLIGGFIADRFGRKRVLVGALVLLGIATLVIGFLPAAPAAGRAAFTTLLLLRLVQSFAAGAAWVTGTVLAAELAPVARRGVSAGIAQAGFPLGILVSVLGFSTVSAAATTAAAAAAGTPPGATVTITPAAMVIGAATAWRLLLLLGLVPVLVALIVLLAVPESSPAARAGGPARGFATGGPFGFAAGVLRVGMLRLAPTAFVVLIVAALLPRLVQGDPAVVSDPDGLILGLQYAGLIGIGGTIGWAALGDRIGRKPVALVASVLIVVLAVPIFWVVGSGIPPVTAFVVLATLAVLHDMLAGAQSAWQTEQFGPRFRATGVGLGMGWGTGLAVLVPVIVALASPPPVKAVVPTATGTAPVAVFEWGVLAAIVLVSGAIGVFATALTPERRRLPGDDPTPPAP